MARPRSPGTADIREPCPNRPNSPCASARYTTTQSARPATIAAEAFATAPAQPPPTATPLHVREPELSRSQRCRQGRGRVAVVAVGREPVDIARVYARVRARRQDGFQAQDKFGLRRLTVPVISRLADTHDRGLAAQTTIAHVSLPRSPTMEKGLGASHAFRRCRSAFPDGRLLAADVLRSNS